MIRVLKGFLTALAAVLISVSFASITFADEHQEEAGTIVDVAAGNEDFSILVAALQQAELVETLQGEGPYTVFAPTNEAFAQLLSDLDITQEELLAQPDLANVLLYHVIEGEVFAGDLEDGLEASTVNGESVTFDLSGDPMVNESNIVDTDIEASNGVIHVVDSVLVPSNFTLQDVQMDESEVPDTGVQSSNMMVIGLFATALAFFYVFFRKETRTEK
ncbi:fasciclin domain-containing protein [Lacicoccus alkaliphilus]|uniref:LPXTG-motif cell wall anchor domain-containing protein n=1 Tax=Lacicoccus alkaliphilus DSM 16010 TaxID=1123231 RepID=A0A1M7GM52_9BACL|nr:fasciclin domain-containing protein [Salinicoccus alkaliphilus]SHM17363.1 LPXTG-motif cell wall anchor domain-containing protein [Salinicoccus alkaliphilus DSM 16010]